MTRKFDFWNGPDEEDRRIKYAKQFLPEYQVNGDDVQQRIVALESVFRSETGVELPRGYASGWRPPAVNEATAHAGKLSAHLVANAGDKRDAVDGDLAWWCQRNPGVLEQRGLWMEHPIATVVRAWRTAKEQERDPTPWCHLTRVPPGSGSRCYFPDSTSSQEWDDFLAAGGYPGMSHAAWLATMLGPVVVKRKKPSGIA